MANAPGAGRIGDPDAPFFNLIRHSGDVFFRYRIAGKPGFEFVSDSVERLTGFSPEDYYRDPDLSFSMVHVEDLPRVRAALAGEVPAADPLRVRVIRRDGRVVWAEQIAVPIRDESGSVVAHEGIVRDITDLVETAERLRLREAELAETQELALLGSWTWDLRTNRVSGSTPMMRRSDMDPEVSFEDAMSRVDPAHVPRIGAWHEALIKGEDAGEVEVRCILSEGRELWLQARARTVFDDDGSPIRVTGTVQDITERKRAEFALAEKDRRYVETLESAPDAVVTVDSSGSIVFVNDQVKALFGYERDELIGRSVDELLPGQIRDAHAAHRARYLADPRTRPMGTGIDLAARRKDGSEFPVDISLSTIHSGAGPLVTAFVRDVTERKRAEDAARELREALLRRRQALEINDRVLQGIAAASYALESGDIKAASGAIAVALDSARSMMADLLAERSDRSAIVAGELVRAEPASLAGVVAGSPPGSIRTEPMAGRVRVVLADDTDDIRMLLRLALGARSEFEIVAEASDGAEAVEVAADHEPDVILLDLAMPVMDGLEAIPEIRRRTPGTRIVVLSGYAKNDAAAAALDLGAEAYFEKGKPVAELAATLLELCDRQPVAPADRDHEVPEPAGGDGLDLFLSTYSHEMRMLMTVIQGIVETLTDRMDSLPSIVVRELLESLDRNAKQMVSLVESFSDANRMSGDALPLLSAETDIAALVRETAQDLSPLTAGHEVVVDAPALLPAYVDRTRIRQVITNLVSNAAKYAPPRTKIELIARYRDEHVEILVGDHGPGIPPDQAARLFRRFSRISERGSGLGLGLFISRGIARAHAGDLVLESTGPEGSTFCLRLPATAAAPR